MLPLQSMGSRGASAACMLGRSDRRVAVAAVVCDTCTPTNVTLWGYRWMCFKKAAKYPRFVKDGTNTSVTTQHPYIPGTNVRLPLGVPGQRYSEPDMVIRDQGMLQDEMQPLKVHRLLLPA